jgi:hypothetical protein
MQNKDMKTNENKKTKIQEKRNYLKGLSRPIQLLVKEGAYNTVNEGLKEIYADDGHTDLKTIHQWNKSGKQVIKGEKALLLWGKPRSFEVVNADTSEIDELDFYPICFVFSQKQVTESKKGGKQ